MLKKTAISVIIISIFAFYSCTTQKNTPVTRTFHNVTSHYNVYFNGTESFASGNLKIEKEYQEDYTQLLPIFKYSIDEAVQLTSGDMDRTLVKMGKTIKVHSITVKPKLKGNLTAKDQEFLKKTEYCKWIDDAYLLMGKSNFYKREYIKALRSFRQIINQYKTEESRFEAELWIAKVYIEQAKYQDAFNYLSELENDVRHPKKLDKEIHLTFADYYIRQKNYDKGIERLVLGIELTKSKNERARFYYILAQLESLRGNNNAASDYFKKVIKMNPNYDMVFSAKIMRATVFAVGQDSEVIKKQLHKMLKDEKNIDYKDQIYYALATIEFRENNINDAILNYKLSAQTSVSNDNQKAISFLALADIYFDKKEFLDAGKYYDSTMQYLNPSYNDYNKISVKAENTGFLVQYLGEVQLQDSLQRVAAMPENKRNALIDSLIADVRAKEKLLQDQGNNYYDPNDMQNQNNVSTQGGKWYMYNPVLVSRGQNDFKRKWGNRQLEDDWRRNNKSIVNANDDDLPDQQEVDSNRVTDNKTREYYLQDLPLTDSLLEISNATIEKSLFMGADVYQKKLNEPEQAILIYENLITRYPTSNFKLETYYRLYNLNVEVGNQNKADYYKQLITIQFPDSKYAKMLNDPNFVNQLMASETEALQLYSNILTEYNNDNYYTTISLASDGINRFPDSQAYPNFLFLKAKAYGCLDRQDSLIHYLTIVKDNFEGTDLASLSSEILTMIQSGVYDYDIYSHNPNEEHYTLIIIEKVQNSTVFQFKLKNLAEQFTDVRTFALTDTLLNANTSIVLVKFFINEDEVVQFNNNILDSDVFSDIPNDKYTLYFISKTNYQTFIDDKILDKYSYFFKNTYSSQVQ